MVPLDTVVAKIFQGLTVTGIGLVVYQAGHRWFKGPGSSEFDTKEVAQATIVVLVFVTGLASSHLFDVMRSIAVQLNVLQEIGAIMLVSRAIVNQMVPKWNFDDEGSMLMYGVGIVLVGYPVLLSAS